MDVTFFPKLHFTTQYVQREVSWEDLAQRPLILGGPHHTHDKNVVPLIGPFRLRNDPEAAKRDCWVEAVTLAMFDADTGPITPCLAALEEEGLSYIAYTSFSHTPEKEAWRLILNPQREMLPDEWRALQPYWISRYKIPAPLDKCKGASHAYYLPSCPPERAHLAKFLYRSGKRLPVDETLRFLPPRRTRKAPAVDFSLPAEPQTPQDLKPIFDALQKRKNSLLRRKDDPVSKKKGQWLKALLAQEPLAEHGDRNNATWKTCAVLVFAAPGYSLGTYKSVVMPSVARMIAAGSSVTEDLVERALEGAMRNYAAAQEEKKEFDRLILARANCAPSRLQR